MGKANHIRISVIIPVYNAAKTLEKCLNSLLYQVHTNYELILINDGSSDSSEEIINSYMNFCPKIICKHIDNAGPGNARNVGLTLMTGDYFCFVDSDDYVEPEYLSKMLDCALFYKVDIVQCDHYFVDSIGNHLSNRKSKSRLITGVDNCVLAYSKQREINNYSPCKLFKSSVLGNIRFPKYYKSEDMVYLLTSFLRCNTIYLLDKKLYYYVSFNNSLSNSPFSLRNLDEIKAGLDMFHLCLERHKKASFYWASYIASRSALFYYKMRKNHVIYDEKEQYRILELFDSYFAIAIKHVFFQISFKRKILLLSFWIYRKIIIS